MCVLNYISIYIYICIYIYTYIYLPRPVFIIVYMVSRLINALENQ